MRLTLRSLLGYLDDILEPQQTKELGEKISESSFAATLVARIREVVRRRRITAPELSGPGSDPDPNVVSEYLDNTLAPEKVEDLERLCLESDVHLAEVASSHQILTMVLGEPVEIPQSTRERMYSLGTVSDGMPAPRTAASVGSATSTVATATTSPRPEIPEYLRRGIPWRRLLPGAAALLVIGVWLGLIFSDPTMKSWRFWEPQTETEEPVAGGPAAPAVVGEPLTKSAATIPVESNAPQDIAPIAVAAASEIGSVPIPPATAPALSGQPDATVAAIPAPTTVMPADLPSVSVNVPPVQPSTNSAIPVQAAAETKLLYNAPEGVLLRREPEQGWLVLPRRTLLHPGDDLACPEPFESSIQFLDSDCEIVLSGPSRVTVLPGDGMTKGAFRIDRGRILVRRSASAPLPETTPIRLQLDERSFTMELLGPGSECGLEISRQMSSGPADRPQSVSFDGGFFVVAGSVRLTPAEGAALTLDSSAAFLQIVNGRVLANPQPLLTPPAWVSPLTGGAAVVAQQTARLFEGEFQLGTPIDATIPPLVEDRHPRHSELGAKTLVLLDDFRGMVRALSSPHQESRQAAIVGLGTWVRRDPGNPLRLSDELARVFDSETGLKLNQLIWGFGPIDAQNPELSAELVSWLGDGNVAVREAAFFQIQRLTGGQLTYRYHPDRSESQRAMSVKQWENHLRKNGALVEPTPTPFAPTVGQDPNGN